MPDYVVIVTGSRSRTRPLDRDAVHAALDAVLAEHEPLVVRHGANPRGPDNFAQGWALSQWHYYHRFVTPDPRSAAWRKDGLVNRLAGFERNQMMADDGADECLAFPAPCDLAKCKGKPAHDTHGTADMIARCERAGIPVRRFD